MPKGAKDYPKYPCPKCGVTLAASGEVVVDGVASPVYQCDDCIVNVKFGTGMVDANLTFCIGADGKPFDPAEPDELLN